MGKANLGKFGGLIGITSEVFDSLDLESLGSDTNDFAGVLSISVKLFEICCLENDTNRFVKVFFLFN